MRGLISDLLDVARIETGTLPVALGPAEVAVLVDEARNAFLSAGGGNNLLIDLPPDLPWVMADRRRIVQVLGNLLSNAAAHSPESSSIRVTAVREDFHVVVSVADEGRGVSAERLPHLFRKFSRSGDEDLGRGLGGSGLGLAICKGIVEAHGGRIRAESDGEGLGARFTFTIPVLVEAGIDAAAGPARLSAPSRRSERGRKRILVVEDDPQALRYVRDALSKLGYAPIVTADPEAVYRLIEAEMPHLVLLDLMLPGTDGIELMKGIFDIADVPVIFLSVYGQDDVIARVFDTGAADYVVKPFSPTELAARIRAALRRRGGHRPARTHGTLCAGRVDHRLRRTPGERCRSSGPVDRHRAPAARRAIGPRRSGIDPRPSVATGLGPGKLRRLAACAHRRKEPPPQAGRRRRQPQVHLYRAARRLPHGEGRGAGGRSQPGALGARCGHLLFSDSWRCIDYLSVFVIFLRYSINLARRRRWKPRRRDSPWTWTPPFSGGSKPSPHSRASACEGTAKLPLIGS